MSSADYPEKNVKKNILLSSALFIILFLSASPLFSETKGVYILCYHAFLEKKDPYSFSNDQFRDQLHRLKNSGFRFVTFEDMTNERINGTKNILVTIDDGNKSVYQAYYSIMKPLGIKPVLGIYPAIIGRMPYAMTWDEVKKLADDGCYIASHGYHHMYLSTKYYEKEPKSFLKEIYLSKKVLEEKLGRKIELMVYPFGVSSDIAISELKKAGYKYGMSLIQKRSEIPIQEDFMLPRYMLTKPNQKGMIAYITKNAGTMLASDEKTSASENENRVKQEARVTIRNYPQEIHKMVMNDVIFMPKKNIEAKPPKKHATNKQIAKKNSSKKTPPKFKPYVHKESVTGRGGKNSERQSTLPDKKRDDKGIRRQSTLLIEIKDSFLAIQSRFSVMFYSIKDITADKIAVLKNKAWELFS